MISEQGINECLFSMFGTEMRLATTQLKVGKIVKSVLIYGVVVSKNDPSHAVLLSLNMKFGSGTCEFVLYSG